MSITVRIPYKLFHPVPPICVCCGSNHTQHDFYVFQSHLITSLSTKFPLCDRCKALIDKRKGSCLIVLVSMLVWFGVICLFRGDQRYPINIITSIIVSSLTFLILRLYIIKRSRKGLSQEEIVLQNKALHAAKIVWYTPFSTTFKFENEDYGRWFSAINGGQIIR